MLQWNILQYLTEILRQYFLFVMKYLKYFWHVFCNFLSYVGTSNEIISFCFVLIHFYQNVKFCCYGIGFVIANDISLKWLFFLNKMHLFKWTFFSRCDYNNRIWIILLSCSLSFTYKLTPKKEKKVLKVVHIWKAIVLTQLVEISETLAEFPFTLRIFSTRIKYLLRIHVLEDKHV